MKWVRDLDMKKKKHFVRYHIIIIILKKTLTDDKLTTCSYT